MSDISRVRELLAQAVQCIDGESSSQRTPSVERSEPERSSRSIGDAQLPRVGSRSLYTPTSSRISALAERNCLFNFTKRSSGSSSSSRKTKKKRLEMWNHDFVCLAKANRKKTPTAMERATLTSLGLGVRNLSMFQHGDNDDLHFSVMEAYPQLKDGGGYELLKANQSRVLEVIPSPADGYTASYLKDVVGQGKVYIRPIQRDLSLKPVASSMSPKEVCLECGMEVPQVDMRSHVDSCKKASGASSDVVVIEEEMGDSDLDGSDFPDVKLERATETDAQIESTEVAGSSSATLKSDCAAEAPFEPTSLSQMIIHLQLFLKDEFYEFQVRREHVLDDLLLETKQSSFHPLKRITTWFIGESGRDTGGVTRELWRLLGHAVYALCEGDQSSRIFRHDSQRVGSGDFKRIGILVGMSLVQGGSGLPFFSSSLYDYICGKDVCTIQPTLDEIPDTNLRTILTQLKGATSDDDVCSIAMDCCDDILTCGFNKPLTKLKIGDVDHLIQSVALHSTILRIKSEIDQFTEGLHEAGVLHAIKEYPHLFYPMFVKSDAAVLDADFIINLFKQKVFSDPGSSSLKKEQDTYFFFRSFLNEVEGGEAEVKMSDVLSFFTGADSIPPLGFGGATLNFNDENPYPTASTCTFSLTLPTRYHLNYDMFKENFIFSIQNHGGFGLY